jgi:ATP-dependent DNA helicase RecG
MDWLRRKVWSLPVLIRNPGGLHNTLTEENLYAGCQPVRRNQILAGFLRD